MTAPIRTDALSLALPKVRLGSRARRKPKMPKGKYWLAATVIAVVAAVWNLTDGYDVTAIAQTFLACFYWRQFTLARRWNHPLTTRELGLLLVLIVAQMVGLSVS